MKIRIITCHDVANYGAALQALALQTYLERLGQDVKIIDYCPQYSRPYELWIVNPSSHLYKPSQYFFFFKLFWAIRKYFQVHPTLKRLYAFKEFNKKYFKLTRHYSTYEELVNDPPQADMYIAGSDQIWSTYLQNGKDPAFYCAFGNISIQRISYAASFGFSEIFGYDSFVKSMLTNFNKLSARENTGVKIIQSLNLDAVQVLDPVLLLNKDEWISLLDIKERYINEKYILIYDIFHDNNRMKEFSFYLAKKYDLKIVAINDSKLTPYANVNINNAGPKEFVNLIFNAEYVLADSFHATAFSVIFNKQFYVFYTRSNISRMEDFLRNIDLLNRLNPKSELSDIIWVRHNLLIDNAIKRSKNFLNECIV